MKKSEFLKAVKTYVEEEKAAIAEHKAIAEMLKPLVGKPINGKTLNSKVLGEFTFGGRYSMYHVKGPLHEHLIGYSSYPFVSLEPIEGKTTGFYEMDACSGRAAEERIKQIENTDLDKAFKIFSEIDKSIQKVRTLFGDLERERLGSYHFPPYYDVLRLVDLDEKQIQLTNFYYTRK